MPFHFLAEKKSNVLVINFIVWHFFLKNKNRRRFWAEIEKRWKAAVASKRILNQERFFCSKFVLDTSSLKLMPVTFLMTGDTQWGIKKFSDWATTSVTSPLEPRIPIDERRDGQFHLIFEIPGADQINFWPGSLQEPALLELWDVQ